MPRIPEWITPTAIGARFRTLYRGVRHRAAFEREMREEFEHHLAARTDDLVRRGLTPAEARERAQREFGHAASHRAHAREAMGLASIAQVRFSWLDLKVGVRMLRKHPMLNLAAIFALAVGIPVGLAPSHVARALAAPIPGDADDRVRAIRQWDPLSSSVAATWDGDFAFWQHGLRGFSALGAFRATTYSVAANDAAPAPAAGAQVSASVFPMLGARAAFGRVLDASDFATGAPEVAVIGHALWSSRFGRDPGVLGRGIRIGRAVHVVVGVMPEGFAFPSKEELWLPLRLGSVGGEGAPVRVQVVGQLAEGVTTEQAQAELTAKGAPPIVGSVTGDEAAERARLRAEVVPFGLLFLGLPAGGLAALPEFRFVQLLMFALLLVACGNVAMLIFARTATRLRELAIRTALGAGRARIVSQLFVETLVLAVVAAGAGLLIVDWAIGKVNIAGLAGEAALPWWLSLGLTRTTVVTALLFAAVSATVAGVIPALAITGRAIAQQIGGAARIRFGRLTGALVVADIAVAVAAVGMAFAVSGHAMDLRAADRATGIAAAEYLGVSLRLPDEAARVRIASAQRELVAALEREPGVRRVAVADALPRMEHRSRPFELESSDRAGDAPRRWTRVARVDVGYLGALDRPILRGRGFARIDVEGGHRVAIVNTAFVEQVLEGAEPLGRRVRFPATTGTGDGEWHEIVGVIGPLGVNVLNAERGEAVYLPAAEGDLDVMQFAIHTSLPPASLTGRVRELATAVDPDLVVGQAAVLGDVRQGDWYLVMGLVGGLVLLAAVLVALATSGLYAMLSLSVSERTREIGIRAALGASRGALLATILRRPLAQIGLGALIGLPLAARFVFELTGPVEGSGSVGRATALALGLASAIVLVVALASCLVPMRRILAIEASEAMRADG